LKDLKIKIDWHYDVGYSQAQLDFMIDINIQEFKKNGKHVLSFDFNQKESEDFKLEKFIQMLL